MKRILLPLIGVSCGLCLPASAMAMGTPTNRLTNTQLSLIRGGQPAGSPRAHLAEIARDGTTADFQSIDGATWVAFDNWLATTGVQLIAANAFGPPPGLPR